MASKASDKIQLPINGINRVSIKNINPSVQSGEYPAKSSVGELIHFSAVIIADGHDKIFARLLLRYTGGKTWKELELKHHQNDEWTATYLPIETGIIEFKIQAWVSKLESWQDGFIKKRDASVETRLDELKGLEILNDAVNHASKADHKELKLLYNSKKEDGLTPEDINPDFYKKLVRIVDKNKVAQSSAFNIIIERVRARFSTWYELFPRSCAPQAGLHGNFSDVINKLPILSEAGFNVLYMPPIHPIGEVNRKGKNNNLKASSDDPGSPWAIGSHLGGHKSIHPELGTMEDFKRLIKEAKKLNMELAMDIAFQCAPDHPYVKEHPEWFKWRADGTVQFAENPPKKYEDILPFDFESKDWESLWDELLSIFNFWIDKGVKVFRVDNPHTKSLRLWEWLIKTIQTTHPETIFLAEAFTRPNVMEHLAMAGFTQSYTYFTWRNAKSSIEAYLLELTTSSKRHYFRPNFWPNTPDILPDHLVTGGDNMHIIRVLLAATLSSNYGIYGPVYELGINKPMEGKEEYTDNEKYEIKYWPKTAPTRIWETIKKINQIRNKFEALQMTNNIHFMNTSNDNVMAYLKLDELRLNHIMVIINIDPLHTQNAWIQIPFETLKALYGHTLKISDELNNETYEWSNEWNYVELDPNHKPAHIFSFTDNK
jgi:starch synthase (maltosyl-transferring)